MSIATIEAAMDRYAAAAKAAGLELCVIGDPFDEAAARRAFADRGIVENSEYFAVLRRWNGVALGVDQEWWTTGFDFVFVPFERAVADFDMSVDIAFKWKREDLEEEGEAYYSEEAASWLYNYFPCMLTTYSGIVGFEISGSDGGKLFERPLQEELHLKYPDLAGFFESLAIALEQGIDLNPDDPEIECALAAERRYYRICREMFPDIAVWRENGEDTERPFGV